MDVWFIWAEEKGYDKRMKANKAEIHSVEYNFSESKPFEEELIKLFNGPLVTYFIKYIWKNKTKEEYIVDENPDKYELLV